MASFGEDNSDLTTRAVLKREIPWESFLTARLISDNELQLIRRYDKRPPDVQNDLLIEAGPQYIQAFLTVIRNVTKEEVVQYVLALLDNLVSESPSRISLFNQLPVGSSGPDFYTTFLRLLQRTDWFTQEKAAHLLTLALEARPRGGSCGPPPPLLNGAASTSAVPAGPPPDPVTAVLSAFIDWLCSQLRRPTNPTRSVPAAVSCLARLLKEGTARQLVTRAGGVPLLVALVGPRPASASAPTSVQLSYEAILGLWQLSYYGPAAEAMAPSGLVPALTEVARLAPKEKVLRVALLTLKNLLGNPALDVGPNAVEAGLPKVVAQRLLQTFEDEDVSSTLEWLKERLAENIRLLSSWDKYKKEILTGSLDWSPMHTSEAFWLENGAHLEDKDFQILKVLLKLLENSRDGRTLAVAANDLSQFITYVPHGRQIVQDLRGKELVMRLMMHPAPEVQKQALLAVQKIMLAPDKLAFLQAAP
eukprot:jgi/Botrbrau1/5731/Bobra.0134s0007.1